MTNLIYANANIYTSYTLVYNYAILIHVTHATIEASLKKKSVSLMNVILFLIYYYYYLIYCYYSNNFLIGYYFGNGSPSHATKIF
jgi:hypothetical protein